MRYHIQGIQRVEAPHLQSKDVLNARLRSSQQRQERAIARRYAARIAVAEPCCAPHGICSLRGST